VVFNAEILDHLRHTLLEIVNQERKGEVPQGESIKAAYDMLMALGMDSPLIYEEVFERPFLAQSAEFYKVTVISNSMVHSRLRLLTTCYFRPRARGCYRRTRLQFT